MISSIALASAEGVSASSHRIVLEGASDLRSAGSLREQLLAALHAHPSVVVDTRQASSFDTGSVQVLLAASRSAARAGRDLRIIAEADGALPEAMTRLGLRVDAA